MIDAFMDYIPDELAHAPYLVAADKPGGDLSLLWHGYSWDKYRLRGTLGTNDVRFLMVPWANRP